MGEAELATARTGSGNVSKAWKIIGYSWQQFYETRRNFQLYGAAGWSNQLPERGIRIGTE